MPDEYIRELVKAEIDREFQETEKKEIIEDTQLGLGLTVNIKFSSQDIDFNPDVVTKILREDIITTRFLGKPKDNCYPGEHLVRFSITDKATDHEYVSKIIQADVVDYAFDRVSRPLLSKTMAIVTGLAAVATFALTFFEQIDTTYGLTAGATAALVTATIYGRFFYLYQLARSSVKQSFGP